MKIMNIFKRFFVAQGASIDAIWLTIVRVVTMVLGLICIKIISVYFSLGEYSIYAQATLIISTACSFSILGLTDAVNYFYNSISCKDISKDQYITTIFGIQTIIGIITGLLIIIGSKFLTDYFNSPKLMMAIGWIAFQPLLQNYIAMLQVLYISVGRAKSIAFINLTLSFIRLGIFSFATFWIENIVTILALTLVCDMFQVVYFLYDLSKHGIIIKINAFCNKICWPILCYAVPMAAFVIINSLLRDTDKWVIGYFASNDDLAIYTNCSRVLPFDILTTSFITVLVPTITKYITGHKNKVQLIIGDYLNIGLFLTSILAGIAIWLSKDLLLCLYDEKYLPGIGVFIIFLFVDLIRFANLTIIYSASGNAKKLLNIVVLSFILNLVGAIVLYHIFGLLGPAIATLVTTFISYLLYIKGGSKIIQTSILGLIDFKKFIIIMFEVCLIGYCAKFIGDEFLNGINNVERFLVLYSLSVLILLVANFKPIYSLIKSINHVR